MFFMPYHMFANIFSKGFYYTVQENDTLEILSRRYGTPVNNIIISNTLSYPYILEAGEKLFIPGIDEPISPNSAIYTVRLGDSLDKIAARFNVSIEDIMEQNYIKKKDTLYIGQKLLIPAAKNNQIQNNISNSVNVDNNYSNGTIVYKSPLCQSADNTVLRDIQPKSKFPVLKRGERNNDIIKFKRLISALGYRIRRMDNVFDIHLENEIRRIQRDASFEQSGIVDEKLWEYVFDKINYSPPRY